MNFNLISINVIFMVNYEVCWPTGSVRQGTWVTPYRHTKTLKSIRIKSSDLCFPIIYFCGVIHNRFWVEFVCIHLRWYRGKNTMFKGNKNLHRFSNAAYWCWQYQNIENVVLTEVPKLMGDTQVWLLTLYHLKMTKISPTQYSQNALLQHI